MKRAVVFTVLASLLFFSVGAVFAGGKSDGASGERTKMVFYTFLNPSDDAPRSIAQNQIIDSFKRKYPNADLEVQVLGWADIAPRLIQAGAAGNPPDVTRVASDSLAQQFAAGTLQDLNPFINKMPNPDAYKKDFVLPYELGLDNGQKKAFWIDHRAVMLYYNKNHLREIGLTEPPKSWDEVGAAAQKLAARGYVGMAIGLGQGGAGNGFVEWFKPTLWSAGGDLLDSQGKAAFNSPAGVKAMQLLYDFVYKYNAIPEDILNTDVDGIFQAFQAGRVSMMSWANHRFTTAQQSLNINGADVVGMAPMPSFDGLKPAPAHVTGWMLAIPKGSKQPELAWAFIENHISVESNVVNAKVGGELATRNTAFDDPWFINDSVGKELTKVKQYINDYGRMPQFPSDYLRLHEILCNAAQKIILQKQPIQATLDAAAREYDTK
jgi:multiple sugar transport system substrate-binding protein